MREGTLMAGSAFPKPVPDYAFPKWHIGDGEVGRSRIPETAGFGKSCRSIERQCLGRLRTVCSALRMLGPLAFPSLAIVANGE